MASSWLLGFLTGGALSLLVLLGAYLFLRRQMAAHRNAVAALRQGQERLEGILSRRVADLEETRARAAGVIDSAMDAILTVDDSLRVIAFNAAAETMFGCPTGEAIGAPLDRFVPERYRAAHAGHIRRFGETGVTDRQIGHLGALSGLRADGEEFPIEASISQVEVGGRKLFTVILRDVTERQRAEEDLRRAAAELEERVAERTAELKGKNKELETFTYSVSHDLKAPLRGIDGYSRLLLDDHSERLDDEGRQFLRNIRQGASLMQRLIDDLLAYSRAERRALAITRVPLRPVIDSILKHLQGDIEKAEVSVDVGEAAVHADLEGLNLALRNLVDNAAKFSRAAEAPRIDIQARADGGRCVLSVRDNGTGFDMKYHDLVFQIFHRLHRAEDYEGTGIGLAIVRKAMERMGGRVWAESRPGDGAVFYLDLPRAD
jgi:PAS domain S-box-containing protein